MNADAAPALSVVLPVYNAHPPYLQEAVSSVLRQSFADFELIVIEDASPRSAASALASFDDPRIRHVQNPTRKRLGGALNHAIGLARAPYIARIDADDVCETTRFAEQMAHLQSHPELDVLGTQISVIDDRGVRTGFRSYPTEHETIVRTLRRYNCFSHPSVVFKKSTVTRAGGYIEGELNEDYDLWCKLAVRGARLANLPDALVRYRFHSGALKFEEVHEVVRMSIVVKERYFQGDFDARARLRLLAERTLLALPPRLVIQMFRAVQYRPKLVTRDRH